MKRIFLLIAALGLLFVGAPTTADAHHIKEGDVRFKVTCNWSHTLNDDPIVFPNVPGAAHSHEFFGNRGVDAFTDTYAELLAEPTNCNDTEDHAGYWQPTAYSNGVRVQPSRMTAYYRRGEKHGEIEPYPDGLSMIADGIWQCNGPGGVQMRGETPAGCVTDVTMEVAFPDCWDGVNIHADDPHENDHVAFSTDNGTAHVCPASHPVQIPELTTFTHFPDNKKLTSLSSGGLDTLHGDFFNGWTTARLLNRVDFCLNGLRRCDSGG